MVHRLFSGVSLCQGTESLLGLSSLRASHLGALTLRLGRGAALVVYQDEGLPGC